MLGSSNAVNLTDGLDGLAIVPTIIAAGVFALIAYLVGNRIFADYLQLQSGRRASASSACFCAALVGAGHGLPLVQRAAGGGVHGRYRQPRAWAARWARSRSRPSTRSCCCIVGGLFVVETVSVIVQVFWYKRTGRRVFLMAPLHHHFEKKGWAEPTIVIRFWIISMILALVGLATLKIR